MVISEGFVNHQEHDAGEEREGQADEDGDLEGKRISHPDLASCLSPQAEGVQGTQELAPSLACSVTLSQPPAGNWGLSFPLLPDIL